MTRSNMKEYNNNNRRRKPRKSRRRLRLLQKTYPNLKIQYNRQHKLKKQLWWEPIRSDAYEGVAKQSDWPMFYRPMINAIQDVILQYGGDIHIATMIGAYAYEAEFKDDCDIISFVASKCTHVRMTCIKSTSHFGNCQLCVRKYGLNKTCTKCRFDICPIVCLFCKYEKFIFCNICKEWHCGESTQYCSECIEKVHWIHTMNCQKTISCANRICIKCLEHSKFKPLCSDCLHFPDTTYWGF